MPNTKPLVLTERQELRLSKEDKYTLLPALMQKLGESANGVFRDALRLLARQQGISPNPKESTNGKPNGRTRRH